MLLHRKTATGIFLSFLSLIHLSLETFGNMIYLGHYRYQALLVEIGSAIG